MTGPAKAIACQGAAYALQLGFMFLVARQFGPELQADYAVVRTTVFLVEGLMWFGLTTGTVHAVGTNFNKYHATLIAFSTCYLLILAALAIIVEIAAGGTTVFGVDWLRIVLWVLSLGLLQLFQKIFLGQGRLGMFNVLSIVNAMLLFVFFVPVVPSYWQNLNNLVAVHLLSNAACLAIALASHVRYLHGVGLPAASDRKALRDLLSVGLKGYVSSIFFLALYRVDFYLVGFFLGKATLGRYTVAVLIVEAIQKVPDWLGIILSSKVAGGHDKEAILTQQFVRISIFAVLGCTGVLGIMELFSYDYVARWLGTDYTGTNLVVLALAPKAIAYGVMVVLAGNLAGRGYTFYHPLAGLAALTVLVILDVLLIERWGVWAAVGAATSSMVIAAILMYLGVRSAASHYAPIEATHK